MPYIKPEDRKLIDDETRGPQTPGELNYFITRVLKDYMFFRDKNYQTINDILGTLEGAKLEFYRRVAAPYEDTKIKENGDVY